MAVMTDKETIQTHDLYYAAYLLASGGKLESAQLVPMGKKKVIFAFTGDQIIKRAHEYLSGEAVGNIRFFKSALDHLKGVVFEKVHE
jgi:hypothetical protein